MESHQPRCPCPPTYFRTIPGILKIVEIVFTILTFAISFGCPGWEYLGGGWVEFTGIISFIVVTIWLALHLINCVPQIFINLLFEIISYCIMTVILFISGVVAAVRAGQYYCYASPGVFGAASFFAFASAVTCGIDVVFQFMDYRKGSFHTSSHTTTVTTTTTSASAAHVEY